MSAIDPVSAQETVTLFRIITVRDETIVGLRARDYAIVQGRDASAIARTLATRGELSLWQYAVRKAADGELEQSPLKRVSMLGRDVLKVEPYATPLRIAPIG